MTLSGRGRHLSDKENLKLEAKRIKSETSVRKGDMEYYASCIKTERSRYIGTKNAWIRIRGEAKINSKELGKRENRFGKPGNFNQCKVVIKSGIDAIKSGINNGSGSFIG